MWGENDENIDFSCFVDWLRIQILFSNDTFKLTGIL